MPGQSRTLITFITSEQCSQLIDGTLPKRERNSSGLYIVAESDGGFSACDYSIQARWLEENELPDNPFIMPEGWVEGFDNLLDAVNWLLGEDLEMLMENTMFRLYRRWQTKRKFDRLVDLDYGKIKTQSQRTIPLRVFSNNTKDKITWKR